MIELLPSPLRRVLAETPELARALLVGGCVRDWLLGRAVKDFDVEVYGLDYETLVRALGRWGRADRVGRSFGVVKLSLAPGLVVDFSLPRRDSKTGPGHRGFAVETDPSLEPGEAALRRDFTINALMFDPRRRVLLDPLGGEADLRARRLRHTGPRFADDPLRVLRGMQFCGRFRLTPEPATIALCRQMVPTGAELPAERVREEWFKWATRSEEPGRGLRFLADSGWLVHFPELAALDGLPQDPEWHPEGDVLTHLGHCVDALAGLPAWQEAAEPDRLVLMLAVLLHDTGKATCTREETRDGRVRIISPGHEAAGGPLAESFLARLGVPESVVSRIVPLVVNHMAHLAEPTPRSIRRLAARLHPAHIAELALVITADASGRPPRPPGQPAGARALLDAAQQLALAEAGPRPLLLGRHLMAAGLTPGPAFGPLLQEAFEAQLDGDFADAAGAARWLEARLARGSTPY